MDDSGVILLVEDNPNEVELTLAPLGENRPTPGVVVASDGEKALDYLYRRGDHGSRPAANPRTVLLDLKLPKVDGLEVLECIKTDPHMNTIAVTMLTSPREEKDLPRSHDLGTNACVVKPVRYEGFTEVPGELGLLWDSLNQLPSTVDLDR